MSIFNQAASLVMETTTTTGTGSYTLAGAKDNFRTFASALTAGAGTFVSYIALDETTGDFECGIGELTASTTLARTAITESSNAGAAVDWSAGTRIIYIGNGSLASVRGKHSLQDVAAIAYSVYPQYNTHNATDGYGFGSLFQYRQGTTGDAVGTAGWGAFLCTAIYDTSGNAKWIYLSPDIHPVYRSDDAGTAAAGVATTPYAYTNDATGGGGTVVGDAAMVDNYNAFTEGGPWDAGAVAGEAQRQSLVGSCRTTDDTPTECGRYADIFLLGEKQATFAKVRIVAFDNATPDAKAWEVSALLYRQNGGGAVLVGTITKTVIEDTAGAATWDVDVAASGNGISVEVTGAAATTIQWTAHVDGVQAAVV